MPVNVWLGVGDNAAAVGVNRIQFGGIDPSTIARVEVVEAATNIQDSCRVTLVADAFPYDAIDRFVAVGITEGAKSRVFGPFTIERTTMRGEHRQIDYRGVSNLRLREQYQADLTTIGARLASGLAGVTLYRRLNEELPGVYEQMEGDVIGNATLAAAASTLASKWHVQTWQDITLGRSDDGRAHDVSWRIAYAHIYDTRPRPVRGYRLDRYFDFEATTYPAVGTLELDGRQVLATQTMSIDAPYWNSPGDWAARRLVLGQRNVATGVITQVEDGSLLPALYLGPVADVPPNARFLLERDRLRNTAATAAISVLADAAIDATPRQRVRLPDGLAPPQLGREWLVNSVKHVFAAGADGYTAELELRLAQ